MVTPTELTTREDFGTGLPDNSDLSAEIEEEVNDVDSLQDEDEQAIEAELSVSDASPENIDQQVESVPESFFFVTTPQFVPFPSSNSIARLGPQRRITLQDKIAEQEKRAAEFAKELMEVGIPTEGAPRKRKIPASRKHSTYETTPQAIRRTLPVSVIRKSPPAVTVPLPKLPLVRPPVIEQLPVITIQEPVYSVTPGGHFNGQQVFLVPSVIFRVDGLQSGVADQLYIPQTTRAFNKFIRPSSPSQSLQDLLPSTTKDDNVGKFKEERLSTKLKRIKDKSGEVGEGPRGYLTQKMAKLKQREHSLQQDYEEVTRMPIDTQTGISSAQNLQRHLAFTDAAENSSHDVLLQMLRGTQSVIANGRSLSKKMRFS